MAIYDMAGAIQQPNIVGAYQQGLQFRNALADLAAKRAEEQRQIEIRNGLAQFYKAAQPEQRTMQPHGMSLLDMASIGAAGPGAVPNSPMMADRMPNAQWRAMASPSPVPTVAEKVTPATPASYDYEGAMNYALSRGGMEQAGALAKLRDSMMPTGNEFGLNPQLGVNPATGSPEFFVTNKGGVPKFLGITERPKLDVKGGWIIGPDGQPAKPLPMTPQEAAAQSRAEAQLGISGANLNLSQQEAQARREREARDAADKAAVRQRERDSKYKAVNDLDTTLAAYEEVLKTASRADLANPLSDKAVRLGNLATQLQMAYKNAADLGAITGPDWAIINRIVATPSGAKAALMGPEKLVTQLSEVKNLSKRQRAELDRVYGGGQQSAAKLPETNAKGWRLMIDANGNRAYVGPNNEIEEVR